MDATRQRTAPKLQTNRAYVVMRSLRSSKDFTAVDLGIVRQHGVYMDFRDAVQQVKTIRLTEEPSFIPPTSPEQKGTYPNRNKIGELWDSGRFVGWGYNWIDVIESGSGVETMSTWVWIEATEVHRRRGPMGDGEVLSARQLQVVEAEGGIDYVAVGQRAPNIPANAVFDEATQDFVFDGEGDGNGGEDQV